VTVQVDVRRLQGMSECEVDDADDGEDWNLGGLSAPLILFEAILCLTPSGEAFLEDSFLDVKRELVGIVGPIDDVFLRP
jgi:hypothetical protein